MNIYILINVEIYCFFHLKKDSIWKIGSARIQPARIKIQPETHRNSEQLNIIRPEPDRNEKESLSTRFSSARVGFK